MEIKLIWSVPHIIGITTIIFAFFYSFLPKKKKEQNVKIKITQTLMWGGKNIDDAQTDLLSGKQHHSKCSFANDEHSSKVDT